ncbi:MAG: alkaline phosphatase family protein [Candidatus Ventricola sp.]
MQVIDPLGSRPASDCPGEMAGALPCSFQGRVVGYFRSAPVHAVTDVFFRAREALAHGRVLVIYIDGLGYSLYHRAPLESIKRRFACQCARTAYPPLTQPCMASMLTGVWPDAHGVLSRRHHKPAVPSLLAETGAVLIEADCAPLALEKEPVLTLPCEGESVDGAVLRAALPYAASDTPLLIVHFHGLDDLEHDVGDDVQALSGKLRELDDAVDALCAAFTGTAILCADHGVHAEDGHGRHGDFDYRDMFVPYGEAVV